MKKLIIILALLTVVINMAFTLTVFRDIGFFSKYVTLGNDIIKDGLIGFSRSFEYSPLYSMFFAILSLLFKSSCIGFAVIINIISGINVFLLMLITKRLFGANAAITSAIIYVFSVPFIIYNSDLLAAPFVIMFNLSSILCLLYHRDYPQKKYIFLSGLFIGLSVVTRPNILIFAILMTFYLVIKDKKHLLYYISAIIICILPITLLNYIKSGELVIVEDSGAAVLYSSNNYRSTGLGYSPPGVLHVLESQYTKDQRFTPDTMKIFKDIAEALHDRPMTLREINSFYLHETKKQILGNFKKYLSLSLKRVWYSIHFFADYDVISSLKRGYYLKRAFFLIPSGLIALFGIAGIILWGKQNQDHVYIILYLFSYMAFFSLFYITERLRIPMIIMFIPFASYMLCRFFSYIRKKNIEKMINIIIILVFLFLFLNYEDSEITYRKEHTKPKFLYLNNIIMAFYENDIDTIADNAEKILKIDPLYSPAWYYVYSVLHDPTISSTQQENLEKIIESSIKSYQVIIDEYRQVLSRDIYNLEAIKFVSSYNLNYPHESEEFRIISDMIDVMQVISPEDPEIYYIQSAYHSRLGNHTDAVTAMNNAIKYGILYSSYYKDAAMTASMLFIQSKDLKKATDCLNLLKNLFPNDRDFQRFIKDRNLKEKLGNFSE